MKLKIASMLGILLGAFTICACDRKEAVGPIANQAIKTAITQKLSERLGDRFFEVEDVEYHPAEKGYRINIVGLTEKDRKKRVTYICDYSDEIKGYQFSFDYGSYDQRVTDVEFEWAIRLDESPGKETQEVIIVPIEPQASNGESTNRIIVEGLETFR